MFPYSSNPYPSFPSSSSSSYPPFPFLNLENASASNTLLHDPLSVPYIPTHHHNPSSIQEALNNLPVTDHNCGGGGGSAMTKPDSNGGGAPHYGISCFLTKKPPKKDRHSKIYTSQGLRDRRVRLSIAIARKFFDLQDMLGFDKASNTLEWLFNKSKRAIKELARSKHSNNNSDEGAKSFSSSSDCDDDCEVVSEIKQKQQQLITCDAATTQHNLQQGLDSGDNKSPTTLVAARERMKLKRTQKEPAKIKESREKARARARERTSNKIIMCNVNTNNNNTGRRVQQQDLKKKCPAIENNHSQIMHQSSSSPTHNLVGNETPRDDFNVIEESIVIKRKLKPSLMSSSHHHHHHHQSLMIPKEPPSFNNCEYHPFSNLSPNWDANGSTGRSNFCAVASMNLSTGLQIFGKSWEECINPR
ncbi:hypothetical protein AAZX31_19G039400 [Glycine max]|uniref:TCP domain-containing protein n=2 Tax=Glycine subgen. Soja TaxID=1462606 RepID=K7MWI6_SOYBN|nr:transcription factor CYCLOIDEA [Glycine max]XP_028217879.1 transcription factor CYCLOIDEA-like [Glycine soja]KAG4911894.1 hypothetical protein JHK86_052327 [Glycine max]KAG4914851.1 hypothetical protein JHK87_052408 [Glycine soja]KAG4926697.1 hypothetical protein JHK85_053183 [Glycine max]KAG5082330.1 hypothetical protein JHK84_052368 [Glycine max]KAG5085085.1 hypothetical protein JHK82_052482 [Glycine max]|eukprot:XP_003555097.1 transcription factor CYCLOIDEA [Glycine max]